MISFTSPSSPVVKVNEMMQWLWSRGEEKKPINLSHTGLGIDEIFKREDKSLTQLQSHINMPPSWSYLQVWPSELFRWMRVLALTQLMLSFSWGPPCHVSPLPSELLPKTSIFVFWPLLTFSSSIFITAYPSFCCKAIFYSHLTHQECSLSSGHFLMTFTVLFAQNTLLPSSQHHHLASPHGPLGLCCLLREASQGLPSLGREGLTWPHCIMCLNLASNSLLIHLSLSLHQWFSALVTHLESPGDIWKLQISRSHPRLMKFQSLGVGFRYQLSWWFQGTSQFENHCTRL